MNGVTRYDLVGDYGKIRAAKYDYSFKPSHPIAGGYGAILMHQAGVSYLTQFAQAVTAVSSEIGPRLARLGIPSIAGEMDGTGAAGAGWGIPSVRTDMVAARTRVGTLNPLINASKVHLVGFSMGVYACLQYALNHPANVASLTGVVGVTDIMQVFDDNAALQAGILAAWGVADRAALAASAANIYASLTALNGVVPCQFFYSSADTTIAAATQTGAATATGGTAIQVSASLNHSAAEAIAELVRDRGDGEWSSITDFMLANDAV